MKNLHTILILLILATNNTFGLQVAEPVKTVFIIIAPENTSEFINIFHRLPNNKELATIQQNILDYKELQEAALIKTKQDLQSVIIRYQSKPSIVFTVVGHNDNGIIYFPDKSSLHLTELPKVFNKKPLIILSCYARSYLGESSLSTNFELSYTDAFSICKLVQKEAPGCAGLLDFDEKVTENIRNALNSSPSMTNGKYMIASGTLIGSTLILRLIEKNNIKDNTHSDSTSINKPTDRSNNFNQTINLNKIRYLIQDHEAINDIYIKEIYTPDSCKYKTEVTLKLLVAPSIDLKNLSNEEKTNKVLYLLNEYVFSFQIYQSEDYESDLADLYSAYASLEIKSITLLETKNNNSNKKTDINHIEVIINRSELKGICGQENIFENDELNLCNSRVCSITLHSRSRTIPRLEIINIDEVSFIISKNRKHYKKAYFDKNSIENVKNRCSIVLNEWLITNIICVNN